MTIVRTKWHEMTAAIRRYRNSIPSISNSTSIFEKPQSFRVVPYATYLGTAIPIFYTKLLLLLSSPVQSSWQPRCAWCCLNPAQKLLVTWYVAYLICLASLVHFCSRPMGVCVCVCVCVCACVRVCCRQSKKWKIWTFGHLLAGNQRRAEAATATSLLLYSWDILG